MDYSILKRKTDLYVIKFDDEVTKVHSLNHFGSQVHLFNCLYRGCSGDVYTDCSVYWVVV